MSKRVEELALRVSSDVKDATAGLDAVASSATDMAREVDRAADAAAAAGGKLDKVAEGADGLASKSSAATGALGALSSGFALVGLEEYAAGLEAAAMATDFMSGVGDALTLVMDLGAVSKAKDAAAAVAHGIATTAQSAATTAASAAQWAFNAAMSANPIGLVVLAVVALVAAVVIAYKKSDEFREVIDKAMDVAKAAFDKVIDVAQALGEKVLSLIDRAGDLKDGFNDKLEAIRDKAEAIWDSISEKFGHLKDNLTGAAGNLKDAVVDHFSAMLAPIQVAIDKVQDLIGWIKDIDFPSMPDLNPLNGRLAAPGTTTTAAPTVSNTYQITVQGAVDPYSTAVQIRDLLAAYDTAILVTP